MKYHITIKNNETGELIHDEDTNAILGGFLNEKGSMSLVLAHCNDFDLAKTVYAARRAVEEVKKGKDVLFNLLLLAVAGSSPEEVYLHHKEGENNEPKEEEE